MPPGAVVLSVQEMVMGWINGETFECDWCGKSYRKQWVKGPGGGKVRQRALKFSAIIEVEEIDATRANGFTTFKYAGPCCYKAD